MRAHPPEPCTLGARSPRRFSAHHLVHFGGHLAAHRGRGTVASYAAFAAGRARGNHLAAHHGLGTVPSYAASAGGRACRTRGCCGARCLLVSVVRGCGQASRRPSVASDWRLLLLNVATRARGAPPYFASGVRGVEPFGGAPRARAVPSYAASAVGRAWGSQLAAHSGLGLCRVTLRLPLAARGGASWRRTGGSGCAELRCVCRWPCARGAIRRCTAVSGLCRVTLVCRWPHLSHARLRRCPASKSVIRGWLRCALGVGRVPRRTGRCLF